MLFCVGATGMFAVLTRVGFMPVSGIGVMPGFLVMPRFVMFRCFLS